MFKPGKIMGAAYLCAALLLPRGACCETLRLQDATKSPLNFSWRQVSQGSAIFSMYNTGASDLAVSVNVMPLYVTRPAPGAPNQPITAGVSPTNTLIGPNGTASFALVVNGSAPPPPGIYVGVVNFSGAAGLLTSQALTITSPGPEPAVAKDAITLWRYFPIPGDRFWASKAI